MNDEYSFFDELDAEDNAIVFGNADDSGFYFNGLFLDSTDPAFSVFSPKISDPKLASDLAAQKAKATSTGNTKLLNTIDTILKYGEKGIAMLVAAGVLSGPSVAKSGYDNISQDADGTVRIGQNKVPVQTAPLPEKKLFSLDFSSPTVIIVTFLVIMLLAYFLFFNKKKSKK